jgi:cytosine/adenosine deaminase-related metal-dependent hydrolase
MVLNNLRVALTGQLVSIRLKDGKIAKLLPREGHEQTNQPHLSFDNAIIFPGLVNSHDHLDFNLFPALGSRTYASYTEWGQYIHRHYQDEIKSVLKVPETLRQDWGIYKNLICGVTTVVNHGKRINDGSMISVYQDCQCIHSVGFGKNWRLALNSPLKRKLKAVIHCGEGIDRASSNEINKLISWNLLRRPLIAVHGVAMNEMQAKAFKALVWCPESNYFLLDQTSPVKRLKNHSCILFGTDSTLTGNWNIWDHIRLARKTRFLTDQELYDTLTVNAAKTWQLEGGQITDGKDADLVIARTKSGKSDAEAFFATDPQDILLVVHKGHIRLFDEQMLPQLGSLNKDEYSRIEVNGAGKYVEGDLPLLMQQIKQYYPQASFPVL